MTPNKHQLGVVIAALLLLPSGAAAYSASFDGGAGTSYETGSGLVVTSGIDHGLDGTNPFNGSDTVYLDGVSISASGPASVTVDQFRGTRTQLSALDATSNAITVDPDDKSAVEISGGITDLSWEDAALDNSNQITFSADSAGTITATDLPNETDWTAATPDGVLVDSGTTTASGEAQISVDAATDEELILFTDQAPTISNASPTRALQTGSPTLSLDVDDPTFGTAQGDSLTVKWFVDGEQVGTSTTSSAGTVTHQVDSRLGGGNHTWHAEVADSYGVTTTSTTQSISIPAKLSIRPINEPTELVNNSSVTVTGRFYSGDVVFEKSTSNGKIDLTGLPVDRTYTLVLSADGYYRRTVIVDSLFEQDSVYLLNDSKDSYYTEFVLNDLTGKFSGGDVRTKLFLERAINTSDGLEWVTVAGDYFGAEGRFEVDLQQEKRYRIRIVGEDNTSRVLGDYTATRAGSVALAVGEVSWEVDEPETRRVSASWVNLTDGNEAPNGVVHFQYVDPAENTSRLQVVIHEDGNASNELANTTFDAGYGTLSYNQTVSGANQTTTDWEVSWTAYNGSGEMANGSVLADGQRYTVDNPIGPKWTPVVVTCLFLFTGMLFGGRLSSIGSLAVTGVAAVMWWLGFYTASGGVVVFAGLVGLAMAVGGSRR